MTALSTPRNATLASGVTVTKAGLCLTNDSTNNKVKLAAEGDVVIGISADESERDSSGLVSGGLISYYPVGGVIMIASKTGQTYTTGLKVYAGTTSVNDGFAYDDDNSAARKLVGVYVGEGVVTTADGDLIPVATAGAATA